MYSAQQSSSLNEEVIDIGKPYKLNLNSIRRNRYKRALQNRSNKELEREARLHQCKSLLMFYLKIYFGNVIILFYLVISI